MDQPVESGEPVRALIEGCTRSGTAGSRLKHIEILFAMNAGSYAFNLNVATSDRDYFGIYAADADDLLTPYARSHFLRTHEVRLIQPPATIDGHKPFDHAIHEAAEYCALLLKGNPKVIEPLYCEHLCYLSDSWRELTALRSHFMTQVTAAQYASYARSQIADIREEKGDAKKKFCHCVRLLKETEAILGGGHPRVWWPDGADRDKLLAIREGKYSREEMEAIVKELREKTEDRISSLPPSTNIALLDGWLVKLRSKTLTALPPRLTLPSATRGTGSLRSAAEALLTKHGIKGTIICALPSGSRLHGIATAAPSHDWIGVFALPTARMFTMAPPVKIIEEGAIDVVSNPTYSRGGVLIELHYFCSLLKAGNLRLLETLFMDETVLPGEAYATEAWQALVAQRKTFVSIGAARACTGMAVSILRGGNKKDGAVHNSEPTAIYHALRLLLEAEHILKHQRPCVHWKGNALLETARAGKVPVADALAKLKEVETIPLTKEPKALAAELVSALNQWVLTIRKELHSPSSP